ncbi:MAG TPA: aminoglycoside phosphotransferase family protein [Dehalococcoidia bacterium]|jgi:streptomycin 6-kinase|nr:aminoglycoside phosphotransferase family protein [Dehalococcoidia bacterium]
MELPEEFVRNVTHVLGDAGRAWLDGLPGLLAWCAREYGLEIGAPFALSFNYVAPATRADGTEAVLKLSPHGDDFRYEVTATRAYGGRGMVRLIEADVDRGVALLDRLTPGAILVALDASDERKTEIAADVLRALLRDAPTDHGLPTTEDWFAAFARHREEHGGAGPLPAALFERGEAVYRELLASSPAQAALLHGDLHHYNILSAGRAPWLAIDPHGLIGDPVFDVGAFFGNPLDLADWLNLRRVLERRADIFAERLGFDRARILAWALAYRVLSAVWSAENAGTRWGPSMHIAGVLAEMI